VAQNTYWQQQVNVTIDVKLNDITHSLDGFETIEYINNSPDTLRFIWFHLWPNAYKNDRTALSEQLLRNKQTDFYFSNATSKGYINRLNFKADGATMDISFPEHIDVAKLTLPQPLAPGKHTIITTPFHVQLPAYFSRSGHQGQDYQVAQWFPKPAVYDAAGWHPMPYLDQGEFYSEFGDHDVQVTLPAAYKVAATGVLQNNALAEALKQQKPLPAATPLRTWHFKQDNVHDFAWFASKDFVVQYDTTQLPSGKTIEVFAYYKKDHSAWKNSIAYAKDGLQQYSRWIGDYPYSTVSIVDGPENVSSGGMEYPTITLITTGESGRQLDATIVHEVGHNWFYGALASNERLHPWMDEGMNTYYQLRYEKLKYGTASPLQQNAGKLARKLPEDEEALLLKTVIGLHKDQPIELSSEKFSALNYGLIIYKKAPGWMAMLEQQLGTERFDKAMQAYFSKWSNKHPYPWDFKRSIEEATGEELTDAFALLNTTGTLQPAAAKTTKASFLFNLHNTSTTRYINIAPAFGYNNYDKIMAGVLVHNYQLPLNKVNFIGGLLVGSGSGKLNGFGNVAYQVRKQAHDVEAALSFANFTQNDFTPLHEKTLYSRYRRIVPSVKLTLYDKDPISTARLTLQWKTFLLREDQLVFSTVTTPTDTVNVVGLKAVNSTINRVALTYSNDRVLYPYAVNFTTDQGKEFVRMALTANYYFNYADGVSGLKARFFAGKFLYLNSKTISTQVANDRYALNMSGPKGYEDYTYSNYFVGRNEFTGFMSQQIMERDGFFKVRTDLLSDKIGKTDDWLMSANLVTDLPDNINPLKVLPVRIPLKVFADIGTYAEAWKNNPATGRFLYDAGVQVSLFKSLVNIYIPILYSKVYRDYFKSTITEQRFLKNISFTIDIQNIQARKLLPGVRI